MDFKDLGRLKHNIYNIYYAKRSIIQILLNVKKQRNKRKHWSEGFVLCGYCTKYIIYIHTHFNKIYKFPEKVINNLALDI